jgi:hypothetical protein
VFTGSSGSGQEKRKMGQIFYYTGLVVWLVGGLLAIGYVISVALLKAVHHYYNIAELLQFMRWKKLGRLNEIGKDEYNEPRRAAR